MNTNDYERGKYLVAIAQADTIVFDKTGTLTKAQPAVINAVSFSEDSPDELLRMAACMEEHFPHSMAKAVVNAARERNLEHEEMHSRVDYIVAHGISTFIGDKKTIIGSHHFVFEDEGCELPEDKAKYVEKEKAEGKKVIMVGDGINDSPALSAADEGIAISDSLMKRIGKNYRFIVGFNSGLIALGAGGILQPATSALLHNTSTLAVSVKSMGNLLE